MSNIRSIPCRLQQMCSERQVASAQAGGWNHGWGNVPIGAGNFLLSAKCPWPNATPIAIGEAGVRADGFGENHRCSTCKKNQYRHWTYGFDEWWLANVALPWITRTFGEGALDSFRVSAGIR